MKNYKYKYKYNVFPLPIDIIFHLMEGIRRPQNTNTVDSNEKV